MTHAMDRRISRLVLTRILQEHPILPGVLDTPEVRVALARLYNGRGLTRRHEADAFQCIGENLEVDGVQVKVLDRCKPEGLNTEVATFDTATALEHQLGRSWWCLPGKLEADDRWFNAYTGVDSTGRWVILSPVCVLCGAADDVGPGSICLRCHTQQQEAEDMTSAPTCPSCQRAVTVALAEDGARCLWCGTRLDLAPMAASGSPLPPLAYPPTEAG